MLFVSIFHIVFVLLSSKSVRENLKEIGCLTIVYASHKSPNQNKVPSDTYSIRRDVGMSFTIKNILVFNVSSSNTQPQAIHHRRKRAYFLIDSLYPKGVTTNSLILHQDSGRFLEF